jgi:hypothetical protein
MTGVLGLRTRELPHTQRLAKSKRATPNVKFERLYKDKEGDESWKSSASFGRDDLLVLRKIADQAHTWIVEQEVTERSS